MALNVAPVAEVAHNKDELIRHDESFCLIEETYLIQIRQVGKLPGDTIVKLSIEFDVVIKLGGLPQGDGILC